MAANCWRMALFVVGAMPGAKMGGGPGRGAPMYRPPGGSGRYGREQCNAGCAWFGNPRAGGQ
jgi:hypothetical protein